MNLNDENQVQKPLVLVLVTGLPCTGKTFIGEKIATYFSLPYIFKDGIKERLFDTLGWSDRAWSRKIGTASYAILFYFTEVLLSARKSFVLESNFEAQLHGSYFRSLQERYNFKSCQIQCVADGNVLLRRYQERWEAGERHPGHVDPETYAELHEKLIQGRLEPIPVAGIYLEVDTTDFEKVNVNKILETLANGFS